MSDHTCTFSGCERPRLSVLYCKAHHDQQKKGKPLTPIQARNPRVGPCAGPNCDAPIQGDGLCGGHYRQRTNGRPLTEIIRDAPNLKGGPCVVCAKYGDTRKAFTTDGVCITHSERRRTGRSDWDRRLRRHAPNGAGTMTPDGYRVVRHAGRVWAEHRLFAENLLGRPLLKAEDIHHVNGNRADNRTDGPFVMDERGRLRSGNLEVWSTCQPRGQEIGPKVSYCVEMLAQYGAVAALWEADLDVLERVLAAHGRTVVRPRQRPKAVS